MEKTFKRETANKLLCAHWALVFAALPFMAHRPDIAGQLVTLITSLSVPVYAFAVAAYGLDAMAKQIIPARGGK